MTVTPQARTTPALVMAAERFGDRPAVVDERSMLTYDQLVLASRRFGAALVAAGVEPGDRVAVWAPNGAEWIVAFLGLAQAGAALVPVNTRFKGAEAADVLRRSRARALVTVSRFLGADYVAMLRLSGASLPDLHTIVVAGGGAPDGALDWDEFLSRPGDEHHCQLDRRRAAVAESDVSDILFTSGTTGAPKGVVQTHGRTLQVAGDWVEMTGLGPEDRYLMVNPYFHMFGLKAGILASLVSGATMLPEAVFDVDRILSRVESERITVLPGPPTLYQALLDHPGRAGADLSSLRVAVTGAADIPVELIRRLHAEMPFSLVVTGYGLTEAGTATSTAPGDDVETIAQTVGRPRPDFELRLVDEHGADVPGGRSGEILLRGASVMSHYLDDPESTAAAFVDGGWLRTGDLGVRDAAGNLRIVGRTKDMFIVGGFNAYPAEIENMLLEHPAIRQAAVIGVPDERLGEVGMAFLVTADPARAPSEPEVIAWCRHRMANYKVPRRVELVAALPLNATGKVAKDDLRALAASGQVTGAR
ncbi:MAG: FadD3 family acyl-CoA ligase [Acidimicrobiales bacterium]